MASEQNGALEYWRKKCDEDRKKKVEVRKEFYESNGFNMATPMTKEVDVVNRVQCDPERMSVDLEESSAENPDASRSVDPKESTAVMTNWGSLIKEFWENSSIKKAFFDEIERTFDPEEQKSVKPKESLSVDSEESITVDSDERNTVHSEERRTAQPKVKQSAVGSSGQLEYATIIDAVAADSMPFTLTFPVEYRFHGKVNGKHCSRIKDFRKKYNVTIEFDHKGNLVIMGTRGRCDDALQAMKRIKGLVAKWKLGDSVVPEVRVENSSGTREKCDEDARQSADTQESSASDPGERSLAESEDCISVDSEEISDVDPDESSSVGQKERSTVMTNWGSLIKEFWEKSPIKKAFFDEIERAYSGVSSKVVLEEIILVKEQKPEESVGSSGRLKYATMIDAVAADSMPFTLTFPVEYRFHGKVNGKHSSRIKDFRRKYNVTIEFDHKGNLVIMGTRGRCDDALQAMNRIKGLVAKWKLGDSVVLEVRVENSSVNANRNIVEEDIPWTVKCPVDPDESSRVDPKSNSVVMTNWGSLIREFWEISSIKKAFVEEIEQPNEADSWWALTDDY